MVMKKLSAILFGIFFSMLLLAQDADTEIQGIAYNRKGGAVVATDSVHYWIEGKSYWEDKYLDKTVIVKGELLLRNDNPVFLDTGDTGELKIQGIPVHTQEELERNRKRYWLKDVKISLVKE